MKKALLSLTFLFLCSCGSQTLPSLTQGNNGQGISTPSAQSSGGTGGLGVPKGDIFELRHIPTNDKSRFYIYVPPNYDESKPIGLVLLFHGVEGTNDPSSFILVARHRGNNDRYILISPVGDVTDGGSGAWCQPFAREIMESVRAKYNIDNKRQFLSSISGGAYPAIFFGLGRTASYVNYCGQTVRAGFQSDFAVVGFTSPAYQPFGNDFQSVQYGNSTSLKFNQQLWIDYGQLSNDKPNSLEIQRWGQTYNYPTTLKERPNEGHNPVEPFSFKVMLFNLFEANPKP